MPKESVEWECLMTETVERLVIEYANLSGRESANRAEFRKRAETILSQAIASAVEARENYWMNQKANEHDNAIREAERVRISEALPEKKEFRVMYQDESHGYLREDFAAGFNQAISEVRSIINPSKE